MNNSKFFELIVRWLESVHALSWAISILFALITPTFIDPAKNMIIVNNEVYLDYSFIYKLALIIIYYYIISSIKKKWALSRKNKEFCNSVYSLNMPYILILSRFKIEQTIHIDKIEDYQYLYENGFIEKHSSCHSNHFDLTKKMKAYFETIFDNDFVDSKIDIFLSAFKNEILELCKKIDDHGFVQGRSVQADDLYFFNKIGILIYIEKEKYEISPIWKNKVNSFLEKTKPN